jgi:hypothetical protein
MQRFYDGKNPLEEYAVKHGLGDTWLTARRKFDVKRRCWSGWHRVKSKNLPVRLSEAGALADFETWRRKRGLVPVNTADAENQ